jgi:hypothetical protein
MDETLLQMMNEYKTIFEVLDIKVSYKKKTLNIGVLNSPFIECTIPSSKNSKKNSASKKNKKNAFQIKIHKNVFKKIKNKMNKETFKNTLNIEKINEHLSILLQLLQQIQRKEKKSTKKVVKEKVATVKNPVKAVVPDGIRVVLMTAEKEYEFFGDSLQVLFELEPTKISGKKYNPNKPAPKADYSTPLMCQSIYYITPTNMKMPTYNGLNNKILGTNCCSAKK